MFLANNLLSVVSVSYNNGENLAKTLDSLLSCKTLPAKVVVVDGGSLDDTILVVNRYRSLLPIEFISEPDQGIYDAMNKGKRSVTTALVHYLNAGDYLLGDPYAGVSTPCLLPVEVLDDLAGKGWNDFVKWEGFGYCHQGVIFPVTHEDYDTRYDLGADFKLICRTFPQGLGVLPLNSGGRVVFPLGGVSSIQAYKGKRQTLLVARENLPYLTYLRLLIVLRFTGVVPRSVRRLILKLAKSWLSKVVGSKFMRGWR